MKTCYQWITAIALSLQLTVSFAADRLEIYPLNQRTAAELIPVLKPMLPPGSAINGNGYQVLVRGDEHTHALVKQALQQLDGLPQNLIINVRFSSPSSTVERNTGAEISINSKNATARAGAAPQQGVQAGVQSGDVRAQVSDKTYTTRRENNNQYRLRVLEGNTAFIQTGQAIPYGSTTISPGGAVQSGVEFRDTRSGFLVRPRLNNDLVFLDIIPRQEKLSPQGGGIIDKQSIQTTVSGKIGEWIELGGVSSSQQQSNSGTLYSTRQRRNLSDRVYLKVELAK